MLCGRILSLHMRSDGRGGRREEVTSSPNDPRSEPVVAWSGSSPTDPRSEPLSLVWAVSGWRPGGEGHQHRDSDVEVGG